VHVEALVFCTQAQMMELGDAESTDEAVEGNLSPPRGAPWNRLPSHRADQNRRKGDRIWSVAASGECL